MKPYFALTAVVAAFAGCASSPNTSSTTPTAAASSSAPAPTISQRGPAPAAASSAAPASNTSGTAAGSAATPNQRSVYFDYDSNIVKEEYTPVVRSNAQYVAQRRARVTIEGNTDDRGSREYNLALGQRRADAVKERLTLLGVPAQQIETVSFGEEKPRSDATTEQALAENRRADIVYGK